MNERIRELWAKCVIKHAKDPMNWQTVADEFAELIVKECAELFVDQKYTILNPHEPFADERVRALKDHDKYIVRKIKQHFGVEE